MNISIFFEENKEMDCLVWSDHAISLIKEYMEHCNMNFMWTTYQPCECGSMINHEDTPEDEHIQYVFDIIVNFFNSAPSVKMICGNCGSVKFIDFVTLIKSMKKYYHDLEIPDISKSIHNQHGELYDFKKRGELGE